MKIDLIRGKGGAGGFNFGFVTFCSRINAAEAVAMMNRAPPLHLIVTYKITDKQKAEKLEQEKMVEEIYQRWNDCPYPGGQELDYNKVVKENSRVEKEELDFDEEVRREKRMQEEVDKFFDDSDSDEELSMLHSKVSNLELKGEKELKCNRCGKEGVARCSVCKEERYCGEACQSLDWSQHRKECAGVTTEGKSEADGAELEVAGDAGTVEEKCIGDFGTDENRISDEINVYVFSLWSVLWGD